MPLEDDDSENEQECDESKQQHTDEGDDSVAEEASASSSSSDENDSAAAAHAAAIGHSPQPIPKKVGEVESTAAEREKDPQKDGTESIDEKTSASSAVTEKDDPKHIEDQEAIEEMKRDAPRIPSNEIGRAHV